MRYTSKDMREKLASANQTLENIGHPWRLVIQSYNGSNFLAYGTPEQVAQYCVETMIYGACGTPQMISHFIKVYMMGAYEQAKAKETLEQRASDLMQAKERAWDMGYTADNTSGLDLQGVQSLIRNRAIEQRDQRRLQAGQAQLQAQGE